MRSETAPVLFHRAAAPKGRLRVSVIIPVRNEAHHLEDTLSALTNQVDAAGKALDAGLYEVLLLANNCTDDSAAVANRHKRKFPNFNLHVEDITLPARKSNIGHVRRMLMDKAFDRLQTAGAKPGIIASTDGDTIVDRQWVHQIITEIDRGNDAVGGRIFTRNTNHSARIYYLQDVMYRTLLAKAETVLDPLAHDAWPNHFQYFGANFAVTCTAYLRAGRLPQVAFLEDAAFHQALLRVDAKVRKSNAVRAYTSTRLLGKVAVGFSEQLQKWNEMAAQQRVQIVEPATTSISRYENRALLRRCRDAFLQNRMDTGQVQTVAQKLSICPEWLAGALQTNAYFGQLWQGVELQMTESRTLQKEKPVAITQAINELRLFLHKKHCG